MTCPLLTGPARPGSVHLVVFFDQTKRTRSVRTSRGSGSQYWMQLKGHVRNYYLYVCMYVCWSVSVSVSVSNKTNNKIAWQNKTKKRREDGHIYWHIQCCAFTVQFDVIIIFVIVHWLELRPIQTDVYPWFLVLSVLYFFYLKFVNFKIKCSICKNLNI